MDNLFNETLNKSFENFLKNVTNLIRGNNYSVSDNPSLLEPFD